MCLIEGLKAVGNHLTSTPLPLHPCNAAVQNNTDLGSTLYIAIWNLNTVSVVCEYRECVMMVQEH